MKWRRLQSLRAVCDLFRARTPSKWHISVFGNKKPLHPTIAYVQMSRNSPTRPILVSVRLEVTIMKWRRLQSLRAFCELFSAKTPSKWHLAVVGNEKPSQPTNAYVKMSRNSPTRLILVSVRSEVTIMKWRRLQSLRAVCDLFRARTPSKWHIAVFGNEIPFRHTIAYIKMSRNS